MPHLHRRLLPLALAAALVPVGAVTAHGGTSKIGTRSGDVLRGGSGNDTLFGLEAGDRLYGNGGSDHLDGGRANDQLFGGFGDDGTIADQAGSRLGLDAVRSAIASAPVGQKRAGEPQRLPAPLASNPLADQFVYGRRLDGGDGDDRIEGGPGNDVIVEGDITLGHDRISGGDGDDLIRAGKASDVVDAGAGNDVVDGGSGADEVDCGPGFDIALWDFASELDGKYRGCEVMVRVPRAPTRQCSEGGTSRSETMQGRRGRDTCRAFGGDDIVEGDTQELQGPDRLYGGFGDDKVSGRGGNDMVSGDHGDDEVNGDRGDDVVRGGHGNDELNGGYGRDRLYGGPGNDVLVPGHGARGELADCGSGYDVVYLGPGDRSKNCERRLRSYK